MIKEFLDLLKKDHDEVKGILEDLKGTSKGAEKTREKLFTKLKQELKPHMKAEEKEFYPVLKEKKKARENVLESFEEHHVTELVLNELDEHSKEGEEWGAKLSVFKELVEHHIEEEEEKVFKDAKETLGDKEIQQILDGFQEEKQRIRNSMT